MTVYILLLRKYGICVKRGKMWSKSMLNVTDLENWFSNKRISAAVVRGVFCYCETIHAIPIMCVYQPRVDYRWSKLGVPESSLESNPPKFIKGLEGHPGEKPLFRRWSSINLNNNKETNWFLPIIALLDTSRHMFLFCFWQVYPQMLESQSRWQKTFPRIAKGNLKNNTSCLVESLEAQALASPSVAHSCKLGPGNSWLFHNVDIKNLRVFVVF